jgi:hypothetical protein
MTRGRGPVLSPLFGVEFIVVGKTGPADASSFVPDLFLDAAAWQVPSNSPVTHATDDWDLESEPTCRRKDPMDASAVRKLGSIKNDAFRIANDNRAVFEAGNHLSFSMDDTARQELTKRAVRHTVEVFGLIPCTVGRRVRPETSVMRRWVVAGHLSLRLSAWRPRVNASVARSVCRPNGPGVQLQAPPLSSRRSATAGPATSRQFITTSTGPRTPSAAEQHQRGLSAAMPS